MKNLNRNQILTNVQRDVKQRINDWVRSGGSLEDSYVKRRITYMKSQIKSIRSANSTSFLLENLFLNTNCQKFKFNSNIVF